MKSRIIVILSVTILAVAALLRFVNLNSLPIFADESIYIRWSQVMKAESTLRFLPLSDGKQPLYMWTVIPALKIISDPLLAGRVVSGLAGLATCLGVGLAGFLLFGKFRIGLIAAGLWAVLPYAVFFDRLALADSLLTMFVVWGFNFLLLTAKHLRLDFAMLAGLSLGFAWLTKSPAIFALILGPTLGIFIPHKSRKNIVIYCLLILVSWIFSFGMYNLLRLGPEFHMIAKRNLDYIYPVSEILAHPDRPLIPHLRDVSEYFWYLLTPVGCLFAVWGLFDTRKTHLKERLILGIWTLIPIITQSAFAITLTARYLLFVVPYIVILISHAIDHLGNRTRNHLVSTLAAVLILGLSLGLSWQIIFSPQSAFLPATERSGYLEDWTAGFGLRDIAAQIKSQAQGGRSIVVGAEGFFGTPFSALEAYLNGLPNVRVVGVGLEERSVPNKLKSATRDNTVYWIANSNRFYISDPASAGLKLLNSYAKAVKVDSRRNSTLFFQLISP